MRLGLGHEGLENLTEWNEFCPKNDDKLLKVSKKMGDMFRCVF